MIKFSLNLPCKPYVKRFLELNYGSPVDFTKEKSLYPDFRNKLKRQVGSSRYDKRYEKLKLCRYAETVEIKITRDDFYRHGWEMNLTDIVNFNRQVEARAKLFMYVIISGRMAIGTSLIDSINYFQRIYNFPEEVWPSESIRKDCQRNLRISKNDILTNLSKQIDKLSLVKLSGNGTISQQFKKNHETANV